MQVDHLDHLVQAQKSFIGKWVDVVELQKDPEKLQEEALYYIGHIIEELNELRHHFPIRKKWKRQTGAPLDFEKIHDEYSDVLHFVVNLGLVLGLFSSEDFRRIYDMKHEVNIQRQNSGY